jgi:hypothetical protein
LAWLSDGGEKTGRVRLGGKELGKKKKKKNLNAKMEKQ